MNPVPTVSVVIATYNYGHFLSRAIDSVMAQTFTDFDVIVVDDGSTDNTSEVVRPYQDCSRFTYHPIGHVGVTAAKNYGLKRARGQYLATLDSDDEWEPTKLERQLQMFESNPALGLVYTRRMIIDPTGRTLGVDRRPLYRGRIVENLLLDNFICYSTVMVKKSVLDDVGLLDESFIIPSDYDLWLRVALKYEADYLDEALVRYREHPGISRRANWFERRKEVDRVTRRFLDEHGGRQAISPQVIHEMELARCGSIAWSFRETRPWQSAWWYLRALARSPLHLRVWRGLGALLLTKRGRQFVKTYSKHGRIPRS